MTQSGEGLLVPALQGMSCTAAGMMSFSHQPSATEDKGDAHQDPARHTREFCIFHQTLSVEMNMKARIPTIQA